MHKLMRRTITRPLQTKNTAETAPMNDNALPITHTRNDIHCKHRPKNHSI